MYTSTSTPIHSQRSQRSRDVTPFLLLELPVNNPICNTDRRRTKESLGKERKDERQDVTPLPGKVPGTGDRSLSEPVHSSSDLPSPPLSSPTQRDETKTPTQSVTDGETTPRSRTVSGVLVVETTGVEQGNRKGQGRDHYHRHRRTTMIGDPLEL